MTAVPAEDPQDVLRVRHLTKTFPGQVALHDVSLDVRSGEVHALLGQNGSGKSSLIKCLAGVYQPDPGSELEADGQTLPHSFPPSHAHRYGMAFVHQDLGLIGSLSVAENLALGVGYPRRGPLIDWRAQRARAGEVLEQYGISARPDTLVADLPVTERTLLAVARALEPAARGMRIGCLVLDEPTAALPAKETAELFEAIRSVAGDGVGVLYVSHRLEEIFELCDRVTVLRDGRSIATRTVAELDRGALVDLIVGERQLQPSARRPRAAAPEPRLDETRRLLAVQELSGDRIGEVTFTVDRGEVVGVAGLAGSGRSELARLLFGAQRPSAGTVTVDGAALAPGSVRSAMDAGVALAPEDRRRDGCVLPLSVGENLTLTDLGSYSKWRRGLDLRGERQAVVAAVERYRIRPGDPSRVIGTLSGGNQQKVVLAKWMMRRPKLLVLDEPFQGIDIGAKVEIETLIAQAAGDGLACVMIDSDFENLVRICDRVLVLAHGTIVDTLHGDGLHLEGLLDAVFAERQLETETA